jgi:hypothetical protein
MPVPIALNTSASVEATTPSWLASLAARAAAASMALSLRFNFASASPVGGRRGVSRPRGNDANCPAKPDSCLPALEKVQNLTDSELSVLHGLPWAEEVVTPKFAHYRMPFLV